MKSVQQVKQQESLKKWVKIITEQRASGLSALAYCKREGITSTTFYYWQGQIQRALIQQKAQQEQAKTLPVAKPAPKESDAAAPKADVQFAALSSAAPAEASSSLELRCGPVQMVVSDNTSPELLKRTLCVLRDVFPSC